MMKAWILDKGEFDLERDPNPLRLAEVPLREPADGEVLIKVHCCGICHTELDEIEGRALPSQFPVIPGHQVVGTVEKAKNTKHLKEGDRVGIAWIFSSCGNCDYCAQGKENLCSEFKGTGKDANGGYAEYITIHESFAYPIPEVFTSEEAAPLLCAGAIGYRSLKLANLKNGQVLGLTGFGASGHLVLKLSQYLYPDSKVIVFARSKEEQEFSIKLGAFWAGDISDHPPCKASAIIDTTPAWKPVVGSMEHLDPGGRLVINAIRKENADKEALLSIDYGEHLWLEKEIKSVANITRNDVTDFLKVASQIPIKPEIEIFPFEKANEALVEIKKRHAKGAKVLVMPHTS